MQLTEQNVQEVIVEASKHKAVFIFFYINAKECEKAASALKTAISEDNSYISLVEADVTQRVGQAIAGQLGLQSVPTLVIMQNSRPVDALQGDEIVEKLPETIKKYMPSAAQLLIEEAQRLEAEDKTAEALVKAQEAYTQDEKNTNTKLVYARLLIKQKSLQKAHTILDNLHREEQDLQEFKDLLSALTLAEQAQDSPALKELENKYKNSPENTDIVIQYAVALSEVGKKEQALALLYSVLAKDLGNENVKKTFLDILNTLGGEPLQNRYRRKLYTLMY
jgi:putative thioredoxin